jgi:hypothetical protein
MSLKDNASICWAAAMQSSDTAAQRSAAAHDLAALRSQLLPKCSCISTALMWLLLLLLLLPLLLHPTKLLLCYEWGVLHLTYWSC